MEDAPPLSQAPQEVPSIFLNPDSSPWSIFVQSDGIIGRPRLARTLKKAGASICSDPKEAQVILINIHSRQGKKFLRDWGADENKAVLDYSWVQASVAAGKVLRENNWCGYLAIDDGIALSESEDDAPDNSAPAKSKAYAKPLKIPKLEYTSENAVASLTSQSPRSNETSISNGFPQNSIPPSQPALPLQPFHNGSTNDDPSILMNQQSQHSISQIPPAQMQAMVAQINPDTFTLVATYLQNNGMAPGAVRPPLVAYPPQSGVPVWNAAGLAQYPHHTPSSVATGHNFSFNTTPSSLPTSNPLTAPIRLHSSDNPVPPTDLPPSLRRRHSSLLLNANPESASAASSSTPPTSSTPHPIASTTHFLPPKPSQHSSIFNTDDGEELLFFVDLALTNRNKLVPLIKKNGGRITTDFPTADYVILAPPSTQPKDFKRYIESADAAGTVAVRANFIYESISQNRLVDSSMYEFPLPSNPASRRKRIKVEDEHFRIQRGSKRGLSFDESLSTRKPVSANRRAYTPSPSPPPESARVLYRVTGGYRYSEEERNFTRRYLKILFKRDCNMGTGELAAKLSRKMPHHSKKSWGVYLTRTIAKEVEILRKRAQVAYRKEEHAKSMKTSTRRENMRGSPSPSKDVSAQQTSKVFANGNSRLNRDLEDDLEVVSQYFAVGGGDTSEASDDIIWARLTEQTRCKTARTWEEFYNKHHVEVNARYERLCQENYEDLDEAVEAPGRSHLE